MAEAAKKTVPPYATYGSLVNLINGLRDTVMPSHITQSVVPGSNSGKATMIASLKALGFVGADLTPTERFRAIVRDKHNFEGLWAETVKATYPFLFDGSIDLNTTTTEILKTRFQEAGASGSTLTKCVSFFLAAAKSAQIDVHPRVKAPAPPSTKRSGKGKPVRTEADEVGGDDSEGDVDAQMAIPDGLERITVSLLRGMPDALMFFPANLTPEQAKRAVKAAVFNLRSFYELEED